VKTIAVEEKGREPTDLRIVTDPERLTEPSKRESPKALISYSHDSREHEQAVLSFCNRLRANGIDAFIDQFLPGAPSEGWPLWMERQIEQRDYTLLVCTEPYLRRFMEVEVRGIGRGVVWEARILRNLLYADKERHGRIIPVVLESQAEAFVPTVFRGHVYDVSEDRGFEDLLRHLLQEPGAEAHPLGSLGRRGSRWSAFEPPWQVPDAMRTPYFTGREELLALLRQQLAERHRAALSGLGGIGKTQTAIEYAVRHKADYPDGVFWVNAETIGGLTAGFLEIAASMSMEAASSKDQEHILQAVLERLNGARGWLLIFDNVEKRDEAAPFLPHRSEGHIIITSRETVFAEWGIARGLEVVDFDLDEAVRFLQTRTGRTQIDPSEEASATDLSEELGNLPLALEQAAAYIAETNTAFSAYLTAFRKRRVTLLERAGQLVPHDTVAVTWAANFEAVQRTSPAAAEILDVSALLAADAIPFEVFLEGAPELGDSIAQALADPDDLSMAEVLRPLARYSLIRFDAVLRVFSVHRLVQEVVWTALPEDKRQTIVARAANALDAAFPEVEFARWAQCERLVPHVASLARWLVPGYVQSDAARRLLNRTGRYLWERGRYAEAETLHERALAIAEHSVGADHPDVAISLNNLANIHYDRGRYGEAQALHERALAIREKALGSNHPHVAMSLNNLANVHYDQGRYGEAQALYERALTIRERSLEPDHIDIATSLSNLASVHFDQGRYAEARALYERALAITERILGANHPFVARSLNNLANNSWHEGRHAEAEALYERALVISEGAVGPNHPDVAYSLDGLGNVQAKRGQYAEAKALYERALTIREHAFGPDHPLVARSLDGLGRLYTEQGQYDEARLLHERALAILERSRGADHVDLAETLVGLASLQKEQGRDADACALYERALRIKERAFTSGHPEVQDIRTILEQLRRSTNGNT
jgi:tetratricopeptide (TPR) repeat protein